MENITTTRTISSIVRNKLLDQVEETTLSACIRNTVLFSCACIMIFVLNSPQATADRFRRTRADHSFFMVSSFISFYVFMNLQRIFNKFSTIEFNRYEEEVAQEQSDDASIEWIPVIELIDHLFVAKSFKREEIEKKFGIARHRFTEVANALEECWILVRGENNSRVLNPVITRQEIVACIAEAREANQITKRPIKMNDSEYRFTDVSATIEQRVNDSLHSSSVQVAEESEQQKTA